MIIKKTIERGFSLIELLVVLAVVGVVFGVALTTLASIIRSSTKSSIFSQVKQNGDVAMEQMVRSIRNAVDVCVEAGNTIKIYTSKVTCPATNETISFVCTVSSGNVNGSIKRNGTPITNESLADPKRGVRVSACDFQVSDPQIVPRRVTIGFILAQGVGLPDSPEYKVSIPFQSEVTLRNF